MKILILLLLVLCSTLSAEATGSLDLKPAVELYERGEFQRAAQLLTQQSKTAPADGGLYLWLGRCYLKAQKPDEAVRELEKAVQIQPSNSNYHLWLGRAYGQKASNASFFTAASWARKLRREFETAVELSPDNLDARFDLMEFYLEAPGLIGGGRDKAEAQAGEIARRNARLGYTARARLFEEDKKWDLARGELARAISSFPDEADAYLDLADFLVRQRDFKPAYENARKALAHRSGLARARLLLAAAQIGLKQELPQAEKTLNELASGPLRDQDPSFADVHFWLGQAHLAQGKRGEARKEFESALRYDRDYEAAKDALANTK
jgi:tetratricopeptide (TPR) repeat protein